MSQIRAISGLKPQECELLEAAGWGDIKSLSEAKLDFLHAEVVKANQVFRFISKPPTKEAVGKWIQQAEKTLNKGNAEAPAKGRKTKAAVATPKPRKKKAAAAPEPEISEPIPESDPDLEMPHGPVNFEALPEVQKMLADAPLAIPISSRLLSERHIPPAEVVVAALLNSSDGDLQLRAYSDIPRKASLPAMKESRGATAEVGRLKPVEAPTAARVELSEMKLRTVEELMTDGPVSRSSSIQYGMGDERIALLRAPRPETNRGVKPGTRRYIRGVLHDKPVRVFVGGLITLAIQILIPLSILAGPLLILKDQGVKAFANVPVAILAFPLALPIFGILYFMISSQAKCRVCAQRLYVPKHCLKNKKAHQLPYFGHIGALAMHVIAYKWFNCSFCGTSNRIKE